MSSSDASLSNTLACTQCGRCFVSHDSEICHKCLFGGALLSLPEEEEWPAVRAGIFGDYELHEILGRGGMGVVWRATHRKSRRVVALKMIATPVLGGEAAARRFHAEIEAAGSIRHPNVIPLHESGEIDGTAFYAMRYVKDARPADRADVVLKRDSRGIASLMAAVADAIETAHRSGVLHRDLKPGNILVAPDGNPYVTDFGLAVRLGSREAVAGNEMFVGTPAFMAPEQVCSAEAPPGACLTAACDIYGLGSVLYALLSGSPPFSGSADEIMRQVAKTAPVRPLRTLPDVPPRLEAITMKCLEKNPGDRYRTAGALRNDLRAAACSLGCVL